MYSRFHCLSPSTPNTIPYGALQAPVCADPRPSALGAPSPRAVFLPRQSVLAGVLVLTASLAIAPAHAQPTLFADAAGQEGSGGLPDPTVIRTRPVQIDLGLIAELQPGRGDTLVFNLFENVSYLGVFERTERRSPESYTWHGYLSGVTNGSFTLVVEHGVVAANIRAPGNGSYQIRYLGGSTHVVREIDESNFAPCETGGNQAVQVIANGARRGARGGDDGSVIDVLVVYTPEARDGAGGPAAMSALIQIAVDETNTAYANSLINPRLNLVYEGEINYADSGNLETDLERITDRQLHVRTRAGTQHGLASRSRQCRFRRDL